MANKYKNLFIDKENLNEIIDDFCSNCFENHNIIGPNIINKNGGHHRYIIKSDEINFKFDLYFKNNNKTTLHPYIGSEDEKKHAIDLANYIINQLEYIEVPSINFGVLIKKEHFKNLIEYMNTLHNVELADNRKVNNNLGDLYKFKSDIGDQITLTYYERTDRMTFQGYVMNLYVIVKDFLVPITNINTNKIKNSYSKKLNINTDKTELDLKRRLPNSYDYLKGFLLDFLYDTLVFKKTDLKTRDYSTYTFPALKALEGYIKKLFGEHNVTIDKYGFSTTDPNNNGRTSYFYKNKNNKYYFKDKLNPIKCKTTSSAIEECYTYFNNNRHSLFHADQIEDSTRILKNKNEAITIIQGVFNLIERTYSDIFE